MRKRISKMRSPLIAALDIGTSKVTCAIARREGGGELRVIGIGHQVSKGIRSGTIVNMEAVETSIVNAVHTAEKMAGETVSRVFVNVSGGHLYSETIEVSMPLGGQEVDERDIKHLLAQGYSLTSEHQELDVLHVIPQAYTLDNTRGIRDPRGMQGEHLMAKILVIFAPRGILRNLTNCLARCHLDIEGFVAAPYASGLSSLVEDEMDLGVTVIDLGGGTTTLAIFMNGALVHIDGILVGGMHITNDIARGLSTPLIHAERLKTLYGHAVVAQNDDHETIMVPQIGEDHHTHAIQVSKAQLSSIILPRLEEIFELVKEKINKSGWANIASRRVVLTGGASQLPGIRELAGQILERQVRLGKPARLVGLSEGASGPDFSTCGGLLLYGEKEMADSPYLEGENRSSFGQFGKWFRKYFW